MTQPATMTQQKWLRKRPKVAVAIPMSWALHRDAMVDYLHLTKKLRHDDELLLRTETAIVDEARNIIVREFLKLDPGFKYLLMFDDDMRIPRGTVEALTFPDLPIVGGLCTLKHYPYSPVAYMVEEREATVVPGQEFYGEVPVNLRLIVNIERNSGIVPVDVTGAACICIRRDVLEAIEPPWFLIEGMGEDVYFCRKAKEAGFPIHINTGVCPGHIAPRYATFDHWLAVKDHYIASENKAVVHMDDLREAVRPSAA